jgi:hypothetical protein
VEDRGAGTPGFRPERLFPNRDLAPAEKRLPAFAQGVGHALPADATLVLAGRKEDEANGEAAGFGEKQTPPGELAGKNRVRNLRDHARSVARPAVGVHGSAMRHPDERLEGEGQYPRRRTSRALGHEADAAGVVLEAGIVETGPGFGLRADGQALPLWPELARKGHYK